MDKRYMQVNRLDLVFFKFIHKRNPRSKEEFLKFQEKLDKREQVLSNDIENYIGVSRSDSSFEVMNGGCKRTNGYEAFVQVWDEYNGWDRDWD